MELVLARWSWISPGAQRVHHVENLDAALDELSAAGHAIGDALDSAQCESTIAARFSASNDDGWILTILVCAEPIGTESLARLRGITAEGGRGHQAGELCPGADAEFAVDAA
jgi:hypothetical protein